MILDVINRQNAYASKEIFKMNKFKGKKMKDINGNSVSFSELTGGKNCIVFTYPKMGESGKFLPENLKDLKGLTGCTLQCKAYQENLADIKAAGFTLIAVGSQNIEKMVEFKQGLGANFIFLSDENFELETALNLQTFATNDGKKFYHRQTLIIKGGEVVERFDKIAEPANDAANVLAAIRNL